MTSIEMDRRERSSMGGATAARAGGDLRAPGAVQPSTIAEMQGLLADWRAAERALAACDLGDPRWAAANAASAELRATYQRLFESRCPRCAEKPALERVRAGWDGGLAWVRVAPTIGR